MTSQGRVLLVNPLIHDYCAHDFWAKPLGLLQLGARLRAAGLEVRLLDLTSPFLAGTPIREAAAHRHFGQGKWAKTPIPRPALLPDIGRRYYRFGASLAAVRAAFAAEPTPEVVLVSSVMTYWYPGLAETLGLLRAAFPQALIGLGGVYASLLPAHAAGLDVDLVLPGALPQALLPLFAHTGWDKGRAFAPDLPYAHDLLGPCDSAAFCASRGCPNRCLYCGIGALHPGFAARPLAHVEEELETLVGRMGLADLALYDDAFLADRAQALAVLGRLARLSPRPRVHTASGFPCRGLDDELAAAMFAAGFATIRLGLETAQPERQRAWGAKVTSAEFDAAVDNLLAAGFRREQLGVYILAGMPKQSAAELIESLNVVLAQGLTPHLAEYSPVPQSPLFAQACAVSPYDLSEPLFHNPTLLPCATAELSPRPLQAIKQRLKAALRAGARRLAD